MAIKKAIEPKKTTEGKAKVRKAYTYAIGRRKEAVARVRLFKGKGEILINGKPIEQYFPGQINQIFYSQPFQVTSTVGKYSATVKVVGSGKNGQLTAVVHGISRALDKENKEEYHSALKKHHLLTRDSRTRERRNVGQMGRARKKKQSPKR